MVHNKTRDMLPSISSTIIHVRYSEHASVQSSPHLTVCEIVMKIRKFSFKKVHFKIMMQSVDPFVHQTCEDRYRLYLQHSQPDVDNCIVKYLIICHSLYNQFGCVSIHLHISIYQYKRYTKKSGIWGYNHETWNTYSFGHCQWMNDPRYGTTSVSPRGQNDGHFVYAITGKSIFVISFEKSTPLLY